MKLRPYPEYKESGLPWIGKIPIHWKCLRGKWIFEKMERAVKASDEVVTCFRDGVVTLRKNRRIRGFTESLKEIGYQGIRKGDLVIHQMDAFAGAIGVSDSDGKGTPVYSVCKPKGNYDTHYYSQVLRKMAISGYILSLAKGIRERSTDFRFETFTRQTLPVPTFEEQKTIAAFIRVKEKKIAKFIRNKRRLIQLLKEQKQVIINQAVTCGIDEKGNLRQRPERLPATGWKASGVDWLGDIPEQWNCYQLKRLARFNPSKSELGKNVDMADMIAFLPMETVSVDGKIDCSEKRTVSEIWNGFTYFKRGDVVVAKITPCFENGKGAYLDTLETEYGFGTTELIVIRPSKKICGDFLYYLTMTSKFRKEGEEVMTGAAGQKRVSTDFVKNYVVALPLIEEQLKIVNFIKTKIAEIERIIDKIHREIKLIQEYRTRLISDVVTGKVDVRNIKVEDVAEEELLEDVSDTEEIPVCADLSAVSTAQAEASADREE